MKWLEEERAPYKGKCIIRQPKPLQINSKNVKHFSLEQMLEKDKKFAKETFMKRTVKGENGHSASLNANFTHCSFFFVDDNKKAELNLVSDSSCAMNFVFLGRNSCLRMSTSIVSDSMNGIQFVLAENACLDCGVLKHKGAWAYHRHDMAAETGSRIRTASFWGGSGFGETRTLLKGTGAKALHIGLSSGGDNEDLLLDSGVVHSANNTESEVIMRGVAQDSSRTVFNGHVRVESNGRGSKSRLEQQILLLDEDAKAEANPVLEIKNNEVECSHAAAVRQLEEEKLFYMMSRGLERSQAKTTMVTGFLRSSMNRIEDKELRNMFMPPFMRD